MDKKYAVNSFLWGCSIFKITDNRQFLMNRITICDSKISILLIRTEYFYREYSGMCTQYDVITLTKLLVLTGCI